MVMDVRDRVSTNNHVVAGANEIEVCWLTGITIRPTWWAPDPKTDLAVIRIKADGSASRDFRRLGRNESRQLGCGNWCPSGSGPTVTQASSAPNIAAAFWIRAVTRTICRPMPPSIRGTAAAPCSNLQGEVIGVNAAIVSGSQRIRRDRIRHSE